MMKQASILKVMMSAWLPVEGWHMYVAYAVYSGSVFRVCDFMLVNTRFLEGYNELRLFTCVSRDLGFRRNQNSSPT